MKLNETVELSQDEIEALWTYHNKAQYEHARNADYSSAEHHMHRAAFFRPLMRRFADTQEGQAK